MRLFSQTKNTSGGYTLVEIIVYMALFITLSTVLVSTLFGMTKSYKESRATNDIIDSASLSVDRMEREIKNATDIDLTTSVFDSSPGVLKLDTTADDGTPKTIEFFRTGTTLMMTDSDTGTPVALTGSHISVSSLVFHNIPSAHGKAVRVEFTLVALRSPTARSVSYTDTAVLRGSY